MSEKQVNQIVVDGTKATLGRLASFSAKQALLGKNVIILNCNHVVISGIRSTIFAKYRRIRSMGGSAQKGPYFPKSPERIVKRTIRGMLSYKKGRGDAALKRIRCYNETPAEYENSDKISSGKEKSLKAITLKELSKEL